MRLIRTFKIYKTPFMALGALLMLSSCGSYQYVGYDNDGIYSSDEVVVDVEEASTNRTSDNYYANYFDEIATDAQLAQEETGEIFTDIDSYSSTGASGDDVEIIGDYGGWGQVNDQVTINYYNTGWNNWGWGWNDPWLWNGGFGWGWNAGFGWGWNNWRWNRWGFGWGWNDPWLWNGGFGWGHPYYGWNAWGRNGFYGNNIAFNRSRRGNYGRAYAGVNRNSISRRTNRLVSTSRAFRSGDGVTRSRVSGNSSSTVRRSRGTITRSSRGITTRGTTTRSSRTRVGRTRGAVSQPSRNGTVRSSRGNSTRSSGSVRSSRSSSRSSGSVRSSRGSSRSSGSFRSSGGSSRSSGGSRSSSRGGGRRG